MQQVPLKGEEQKNADWSQLGRVAFHIQALANHVKKYTLIVCKALQGKNLQAWNKKTPSGHS
jgi:hypothetical protein